MNTAPKSFDEIMAEYEAERQAELARDDARRNTPDAIAAAKAKKAEDFAKGVRLGWWDVNGDPIISEEDDAEDDDETDEESQS